MQFCVDIYSSQKKRQFTFLIICYTVFCSKLFILGIDKVYHFNLHFTGRKRKNTQNDDIINKRKKNDIDADSVGKNLLSQDLESYTSLPKKKIQWLKNGNQGLCG